MKVVLSLDAVRYPLTGIGRYVYELAAALPDAAPDLEFSWQAGNGFVDLPDVLGGGGGASSGRLVSGLRRWAQNSPALVSAHRRWSSRRLSRALRNCGHGAVFHGPNFFLPQFCGRRVVTIHDLSVFSWPHCHPPGRVAMMQKEVLRSVDRADRIVVVSQFVRHELIERFWLPPEKVVAVALASSGGFRPRSAEECQAVLDRFGLRRGGYLLFTGTIEPRKNIDALLDAYLALPAEIRKRWPLVLCGFHGWRSDTLHARIARAQQQGEVRYLGYVPDNQLPILYSGAALFAFPSLYEGFGLPVLEAMASGVPVVCSNAASLPEVAGDAVLSVDPRDIPQLREQLLRGVTDHQWREWAIARGRTQSQRFSWRRCAEETAAVYRALAA